MRLLLLLLLRWWWLLLRPSLPRLLRLLLLRSLLLLRCPRPLPHRLPRPPHPRPLLRPRPLHRLLPRPPPRRALGPAAPPPPSRPPLPLPRHRPRGRPRPTPPTPSAARRRRKRRTCAPQSLPRSPSVEAREGPTWPAAATATGAPCRGPRRRRRGLRSLRRARVGQEQCTRRRLLRRRLEVRRVATRGPRWAGEEGVEGARRRSAKTEDA
jgi:hypothetical protein